MAVDLAYTRVDPDGNRAFAEIGSESGPEAIEGTGLFDRTDVNRCPVSNNFEFQYEDHNNCNHHEPNEACCNFLHHFIASGRLLSVAPLEFNDARSVSKARMPCSSSWGCCRKRYHLYRWRRLTLLDSHGE